MSLISEKVRKLAEKVEDFTSLDVTTITGKIEHVVDAKGKFDASNILADIKKGTLNAELKVVAHTHIDFDKDVVTFVKAELDGSEAALFQLHQQSIFAAQQARLSMLRFMHEVLEGAIKP